MRRSPQARLLAAAIAAIAAVLLAVPPERRLAAGPPNAQPPDASRAQAQPAEQSSDSLRPPQALRTEHQRLHQQLQRAQRSGGKSGQAAQRVAEVMKPHFESEERIAMPPLGLLAPLSRGELSDQMRQVLPLSAQLKQQLPAMLREHQQIVAALEELRRAATEEDKPGVADFAQRLILHAQIEQQVLYPAAILVGEYVRLKLDSEQRDSEQKDNQP